MTMTMMTMVMTGMMTMKMMMMMMMMMMIMKMMMMMTTTEVLFCRWPTVFAQSNLSRYTIPFLFLLSSSSSSSVKYFKISNSFSVHFLLFIGIIIIVIIFNTSAAIGLE